MNYIKCTLSYRQVAWFGDTITELMMHLYTGADMAGDAKTYKSTTGVYFALEGPHSRFPIAAMSKRQTAVSHSTPEAEIVAGATGLRMIGVPGQVFWTTILKFLSHGRTNKPSKGQRVTSPDLPLSLDFAMILVFSCS